MFPRQHDGLLVKLFWLGVCCHWRETRLYDRLFLLIGGIVILLWPLADLKDFLHSHAIWFCSTHWVWVAGLAASGFCGAGFGMVGTGLAAASADAPYLKVQPFSQQTRRRMAGFAVCTCSLATAPLAAMIGATVCAVIGKPQPLRWGLAAAVVYLCGAGLGLAARLRIYREKQDDAIESRRPLQLPFPRWLQNFDRAYPSWVSSWSIGLVSGSLPVSAARLLGLGVVLLAVLVPSIASLARHQAAPAAVGGVLTGFAAFMLLVRCQPLQSPVLRSAPIGFIKAWFGMLRLPLVLSAVFFMVPAGAAIAAEPSAWAMNVSGGLGLCMLDGAYAIFAAFFLSSPLLAAASFFAVVFYASYKWVTYHEVVYLCCAALLALMGYRIRRSFYDGR